MTFHSGFIAIVGPPNVGKSTLLNKLLGKKVAIVSRKPQTTRNRILGVLHGEGFQMVFLDTPGIHGARTSLHRSMVSSAVSALKEVDLAVVVIERHRPHDPDIPLVLRNLKQAAKPAVLVINKIDLGPREQLLPIIDEYRTLYPFEDIVPVSALTGEGLGDLQEVLRGKLKEGPTFFPQEITTDQSETFLVSEIIREKVYLHTGDEIPYASAVTVERINEPEDRDLVVVSALIHVESNSQKGILIGHKGQMIKAIGQAARLELEKLFGIQVYLDLTVRVEKNWSKNPKALRRLGY
jgi:GTP-binding protein Era